MTYEFDYIYGAKLELDLVDNLCAFVETKYSIPFSKPMILLSSLDADWRIP